MLKRTFGLIPRYNWDFRLGDLLRSYQIATGLRWENADSFRRVFNVPPVMTTSGRASLYVILKALGLPNGAGVGVPLFCCPVVFDAISQAGCEPVFIDIETSDYTLSATDLARKRHRLAAVVAVHMFGHPADMDAINTLCGDIPVIEDCAQSLFSVYRGKLTGLLSAAAFFSFRSGKFISAGEGSAIICRGESLRQSLGKQTESFDAWTMHRELLYSTSTFVKSVLYRRPWYGTLGYPVGRRLDRTLNLSAKSGFEVRAIAGIHRDAINGRLEAFKDCVVAQRHHAKYLLETIVDECIALPREMKDCQSNYYQFVIRLENSQRRDALHAFLLRHGIDTARYLDDVADIARMHYRYAGDCGNAEQCSKTVLSIPHYYTLSRDDVRYVAESVNAGLASTRNL